MRSGSVGIMKYDCSAVRCTRLGAAVCAARRVLACETYNHERHDDDEADVQHVFADKVRGNATGL